MPSAALYYVSAQPCKSSDTRHNKQAHLGNKTQEAPLQPCPLGEGQGQKTQRERRERQKVKKGGGGGYKWKHADDGRHSFSRLVHSSVEIC